MTRLAVKDALLDAQLLRTAGSAPYGGADLGECVAAARPGPGDRPGVPGTIPGLAAAAAARTLADTELAAGRTETARLAFFRAASYDRTAGVMLLGGPPDEPAGGGLRAADRRVPAGSGAAPAAPPEVVAIPFEDTTLPGYWFAPPTAPRTPGPLCWC